MPVYQPTHLKASHLATLPACQQSASLTACHTENLTACKYASMSVYHPATLPTYQSESLPAYLPTSILILEHVNPPACPSCMPTLQYTYLLPQASRTLSIPLHAPPLLVIYLNLGKAAFAS